MRRIYILMLLFFATSVVGHAQVTGVTVETHYTDDGTIEGYPEGHKTYRIYANLTNATDRLTATYGDHNSPLFLRVSGNGIWNSPLAGVSASYVSCSAQEGSLSLYDSFLTIGYACDEEATNAIEALDDPNVNTWIEETFNTAPYGLNDVIVNSQVGAVWFGLHSDDNTQADENLRVLIAQITTDGEICGTFNFQVFPNYAGVGSPYVEQAGFSYGTLENTEIIITAATVSPSCFGDSNGSFEVTANGGTGLLSYSFDNVTYSDVNELGNLSAGIYEIYVKDETGCVAVQSIEIEDPQAISATADVTPITCHDSNDGSVSINHIGGVGMLIFSLDGENYIPSPDFENLSAGTYNIHIMDMNMCTFESDVDIVLTNPDEIEATMEVDAITCNGENDGSILVTASGGVGPYEYNYGEGYSIENPMLNVAAGSYTVLLRDALGCVIEMSEAAVITEPTAIAVDGLQPTAISENAPGGNTVYTVSGGVTPYTFQWTNAGGDIVSESENLPELLGQTSAGTYTLTITDAAGCIFTTQINVSYVVSIDELANGYSVQVFPNPTSGSFTLSIQSNQSRNIAYRITDTSGRTVLASQLSTVANDFKEKLDITTLAAGVYFVETQLGDISKTIRLIKM